MKTEEAFNEFYQNQILNAVDKIKKDRKVFVMKYLRFIILFWICVGIMVSISLFFSTDEGSRLTKKDGVMIPAVILYVISATGSISFIMIAKKVRKEFAQYYKRNVIVKIVKFIDENLDYLPNQSISLTDIENSRLFKMPVNKVIGDDFVEGIVGETYMKFSEVHAVYSYKTDKSERTTKVFDGIMFVAESNKSFKGRTFILPDDIEKFWGRFSKYIQKMENKWGELVKLENPEFEKLFVVYSTDQIEARYILSTTLMERIVDYKKKSRRNILISFVNNNVYIAIPFVGELFEAKLFGDILSFNIISMYYSNLKLAYDIVEDLNLNLRIWQK